MDKLKAMSVFIAVAEEQGFAPAARRLAMSPPAVTRTVAELEASLGVLLLLRTTRRVRLTDAGQQFLQDVRRIVTDIQAAEESIAGIHGQPSGHLVVTAPVLFGSMHIAPLITRYLNAYEQMSVSAMFVDRVTNMLEEGIDVGFRIGALPDSNLRAVGLGAVALKTYASPAYLHAFGTPQTPEELPQHRLIVSTAGSRGPIWRYFRGGQEISLTLKPSLTCTTNDAALVAAEEGYGITRVLSYQAAPRVQAGELVPILEEFEGPEQPVHIVHPQGRNVPAKVRTFIDLAVAELRAALGK